MESIKLKLLLQRENEMSDYEKVLSLVEKNTLSETPKDDFDLFIEILTLGVKYIYAGQLLKRAKEELKL